jgi:endonuclease/exonuclease/phosphatase family metal-dependent hydrolase
MQIPNHRRLFFLLLLVLPLLTMPDVAGEEPRTLRVLCYNIHYGQGNDGEYNLQRLADVIKAAKPDLVALQEVDVGVKRSGRLHEVRILGELTNLKSHFGPTQHYEGGLFGNAVLTNLPVENVLIQPLPYTEATPEVTTYPRGAISVIVTLPSGERLNFISTHFQHNVEADRVAEAKAINQLFAVDNMTTILAGDMNAEPGSEPIRILDEKWKNAIDPAAAPSAPSANPRSRIDYVFHRGDSLKMISSEVIAEPMASDHCPVLAVFEVRSK